MTSTKALRGALSEAINRARYGNQRTLLTVRGEAAAVVVPVTPADLAALEQKSPAAPRATQEKA